MPWSFGSYCDYQSVLDMLQFGVLMFHLVCYLHLCVTTACCMDRQEKIQLQVLMRWWMSYLDFHPGHLYEELLSQLYRSCHKHQPKFIIRKNTIGHWKYDYLVRLPNFAPIILRKKLFFSIWLRHNHVLLPLRKNRAHQIAIIINLPYPKHCYKLKWRIQIAIVELPSESFNWACSVLWIW